MTPLLPARVLLVDDDAGVLRACTRALGLRGYAVECASTSEAASALLADGDFDVVIADVEMPGRGGVALLKDARRVGLAVPFVMMTGGSKFDEAVAAIEHGAMRFLLKPVPWPTLAKAVDDAVRLRRSETERQHALELLQAQQLALRNLAERRTGFERAVAGIWMAHQPIVRWGSRTLRGYEALVRGVAPGLSRPDQLFQAAEDLGELPMIGRAVRASVAMSMAENQTEQPQFVNVHPEDLSDDDLYSIAAPLTRFADRVVLEITERARLDEIRDLPDRIQRLRALGFSIALDDLGAGYAGLSALAQIRPDILKLDMSLTRDIDGDPVRQTVVESLNALASHLKMEVVAEGIETPAERDTLARLGCDLMQGFLFAIPSVAPPEVIWF